MGDATATLLRRIARPAAPPPPLTPARALRLAMTRAAEASISLPLAVLGIREEEGALDDLLGRLEDGLLLLSLHQDGDPAGLIALDLEARTAAIEAQALGRPSTDPAEPREPTAADAALAHPLLAAFLSEAEKATEGTPMAGWLRGPEIGPRLPAMRDAMLLLPYGPYRIVRLTLDLGAGGRQGLLLLMLRLGPPASPGATADVVEETTVSEGVLRSQVSVDAVLHRLQLSFAEAEGLRVGQVLPLSGVTVSSVHLVAGGLEFGSGRLGQVAGLRAVRVETPLAPSLDPTPALTEREPPLALLPEAQEWSPPEREETPEWEPPNFA